MVGRSFDVDYSHLIEKSSPLLIPLNRFKSFDEYFSSLSNSSRSSFTRTKQIEALSNIEYFKDSFQYSVIEGFMEMWSQQKIHAGYPLWGEWTIDFFKEMDDRNLLHCFYAKSKHNGEIIAVHFVFKWGDYVYCNSPLYDKGKYDEVSLGKTMWYQLIRYSIENNFCNYLDLDGNDSGETYKEVINNRSTTASPGDQGYKWIFIPKDVKCGDSKELTQLHSMSTYVGPNYNKGIKEGKNLMIVAHPDDEVIFGFSELDRGCPCNWKVVVVADHLRPNGESGKVEFEAAMGLMGIEDWEVWDFDASLGDNLPTEELSRRVGDLINNGNWLKIVTHNPIGEYGHIQHRDVFDAVKIHAGEFYVFCKTPKRLASDVWMRKQKVLDVYNKTQDAYFRDDVFPNDCPWFVFPDNSTNYQEYGVAERYDEDRDDKMFVNCLEKYRGFNFKMKR